MSIPEDDGRPDPLQRHLLCRATGMHDRTPEGVCRDCGVLTGPDSYVCADDTTGAKPAPDEDAQ